MELQDLQQQPINEFNQQPPATQPVEGQDLPVDTGQLAAEYGYNVSNKLQQASDNSITSKVTSNYPSLDYTKPLPNLFNISNAFKAKNSFVPNYLTPQEVSENVQKFNNENGLNFVPDPNTKYTQNNLNHFLNIAYEQHQYRNDLGAAAQVTADLAAFSIEYGVGSIATGGILPEVEAFSGGGALARLGNTAINNAALSVPLTAIHNELTKVTGDNEQESYLANAIGMAGLATALHGGGMVFNKYLGKYLAKNIHNPDLMNDINNQTASDILNDKQVNVLKPEEFTGTSKDIEQIARHTTDVDNANYVPNGEDLFSNIEEPKPILSDNDAVLNSKLALPEEPENFNTGNDLLEFSRDLYGKDIDKTFDKVGVNVIDDASQLDKEVDENTVGIASKDGITLIANRISPDKLHGILRHELGHVLDLGSVVGEENWQKILNNANDLLTNHPLLTDALCGHIDNFKDLPDKTKQLELVSYLLGSSPDHTMFSKMLTRGKISLNKLGFKTNISSSDIVDIARSHINTILDGKYKGEIKKVNLQNELEARKIVSGINQKLINKMNSYFNKEQGEALLKNSDLDKARLIIKNMPNSSFNKMSYRPTGLLMHDIKQHYGGYGLNVTNKFANDVAATIKESAKQIGKELTPNWNNPEFVEKVRNLASKRLKRIYGDSLDKNDLEKIYDLNNVELVKSVVDNSHIREVTNNTLNDVLNDTNYHILKPNTIDDILSQVRKHAKSIENKGNLFSELSQKAGIDSEHAQLDREWITNYLNKEAKDVIAQHLSQPELPNIGDINIDDIVKNLNNKVREHFHLDNDFDIGKIDSVKKSITPKIFQADIKKRFKEKIKGIDFGVEKVASAGKIEDELYSRYKLLSGFTRAKARELSEIISDKLGDAINSGEFISNKDFLTKIMASKEIKNAIAPSSIMAKVKEANEGLLNLRGFRFHMMSEPTEQSYIDNITNELKNEGIHASTASLIAERLIDAEKITAKNTEQPFGSGFKDNLQNIIEGLKLDNLHNVTKMRLDTEARIRGLNLINKSSNANLDNVIPYLTYRGASSTNAMKITYNNAVMSILSNKIGFNNLKRLLTNTDAQLNANIIKVVDLLNKGGDISKFTTEEQNAGKAIHDAYNNKLYNLEISKGKLTKKNTDYYMSNAILHNPIAMKDMSYSEWIQLVHDNIDVDKIAKDNNTTPENVLKFFEDGQLFTHLKLGRRLPLNSGSIDLSEEGIKNLNEYLGNGWKKGSGDILKRGATGRYIQFKSVNHFINYYNKVNGLPFLQNVIKTISRRTGQLAILDTLGANPEENVNKIVKQIIQRIKGTPNADNRIDGIEKDAKLLLDNILGRNNIPSHSLFSNIVMGAREWGRNLAIWSGVKSFFTDPVANANHLNATWNKKILNEVFDRYWSFPKYLFNKKYRDDLLTLSTQQGLYNQHFFTINPKENWFMRTAHYLNNLQHTYLGQSTLENYNKTRTNMINMIEFNKVKDMDFFKLPHRLLNRLKENGWDSASWERLRYLDLDAERPTFNGQQLLAPSDIGDKNIADKYASTLIKLSDEPYFHVPKLSVSSQSKLSRKYFAPYFYGEKGSIPREVARSLFQFGQYSANLFHTIKQDSYDIVGKNPFTGENQYKSAFATQMKYVTGTALSTLAGVALINKIRTGEWFGSKKELVSSLSEAGFMPPPLTYGLNSMLYNTQNAPVIETGHTLYDALDNLAFLGKDLVFGEGKNHGKGSHSISDYDYRRAKITKDVMRLIPQAKFIMNMFNFLTMHSLTESLTPEYMKHYNKYIGEKRTKQKAFIE